MFAKNNSFVSVVDFDFNVIASDKITISDRNVEQKNSNKQVSLLKERSNNVKLSHTDVFRRRCRLTIRNQTIKRILIFLTIFLLFL